MGWKNISHYFIFREIKLKAVEGSSDYLPISCCQDEFPQNIPHQEKTSQENEPESTCASMDQDENRKQDPVQLKTTTLEENKVGSVRRQFAAYIRLCYFIYDE